jgi:chromosome segregation ATPase
MNCQSLSRIKYHQNIDEKTEKIKEEIIFRQRKIEGLLKNNESELKALQREFTIKKNDFNEKIEEIKQLADSSNVSKGNGKNPVIDNLQFMIDELNSSITSIENDVSSLSRLIDDNLTYTPKHQSGGDNSAFLSVNKKLKTFEDDINEQDKRVKTSYIVAFMSIVFALISILLTFV